MQQAAHLNPTILRTSRLELIGQTREAFLRWIQSLPEKVSKAFSPAWMRMVQTSGPIDPWVHGFCIRELAARKEIGRCAYKGPPNSRGQVEIAYSIHPEHQGRGFATEAARALLDFASTHAQVRMVVALTLPHPSASTCVLIKCGFRLARNVVDPANNTWWVWEKIRPESSEQNNSTANAHVHIDPTG